MIFRRVKGLLNGLRRGLKHEKCEKPKNYRKNLQGLKKTTNFAVANYARTTRVYSRGGDMKRRSCNEAAHSSIG